jgi:pyrroloquinoline quinone (PQQ) biosynthesis protein C
MTFFDQLTHETGRERADLIAIPFLQAGVAGRLSASQYLAFLEQAYHHVRHTVPLLMSCGARLPDRAAWLRKSVAEYIEEEIGHEEWILNDIAAAGGDAEAARRATPAFPTELMVAYAYDLIRRVNPVGFFGMVFVLEGTSTALATRAAERLQQSLGLPDTAFSYLRSHGALDIEHMKFFEGLMNRLVEERDRQAVVAAAKAFYRLYGSIFRALPFDSTTEPAHEAA